MGCGTRSQKLAAFQEKFDRLGFHTLLENRVHGRKIIKEVTNRTKDRRVWNSGGGAHDLSADQCMGGNGHGADGAEKLHELPPEIRPDEKRDCRKLEQ